MAEDAWEVVLLWAENLSSKTFGGDMCRMSLYGAYATAHVFVYASFVMKDVTIVSRLIGSRCQPRFQLIPGFVLIFLKQASGEAYVLHLNRAFAVAFARHPAINDVGKIGR